MIHYPPQRFPPYLLNNNDYLYLTVLPKNAAHRLIQGRLRHRAWLSDSTRLRLWQRHSTYLPLHSTNIDPSDYFYDYFTIITIITTYSYHYVLLPTRPQVSTSHEKSSEVTQSHPRTHEVVGSPAKVLGVILNVSLFDFA